MEYIKSSLSFKFLASGPAQIGRILNYIRSIKENSNFKYKSGYRSTQDPDIASSWALDFMVGLGMCTIGQEMAGGFNRIILTAEGEEIYTAIKEYRYSFSESRNEKVKEAIELHCPDLYIVLKRVVIKSIVYKNFNIFLLKNDIWECTKSEFYDRYFAELKRFYTGENYLPESSTATTAENRLASIIQICDFLNLIKFQGDKFHIEKEVIVHEDSGKKLNSKNLIFYGAPGTGKSHSLDEVSKGFDFVERVTFYPEYTHDDFIGSFMPTMSYVKSDASEYITADGNKAFLPGKPVPYYTFIPGPFTVALVYALNHADKNVMLIIEELNRANAAAVFGEFFQLLDRTASGESKYAISVSNEYSEYLSSRVEYYFKGAKVFIPANFTICATMNSADQGVNPLDSAFKRRWNFKYIPIDFSKAVHKDFKIDYAKEKVTWETFAATINNQLKKKDINEDKHLGQYFIKESEIGDLYNFASKILLYLFDDVLKFNRRGFFKSEYKTFSDLLAAFIDGKEVFEFKFDHTNSAEKTGVDISETAGITVTAEE